MLLTPIAAQANASMDGGTVTDVAQDGFTAVGLSYQTGVLYEAEINAWLDSGLCMLRRLWPARSVQSRGDPHYHGPVGSLIETAQEKTVLCSELMDQSGETTVYVSADPPTNKYCIVEEIEHASDAQMDAWVEQVEQTIINTVADPLLNNRTIAWYMGPEEPRPNRIREMELLERVYSAVQQYDPLKRPAWTYSQQRSDPELLLYFAPSMDVFTVGAYPNNAGNMHQRLQVVHAMRQMNRANTIWNSYSLGPLKRIIPALEMYESAEAGEQADPLQVTRFVRHDAYAAFANGADGIIVWSMGQRDGFLNYSNYYAAWAQVVQETMAFGLRDVFATGQIQEDVSVSVLSGEEFIKFRWATGSTPPGSAYDSVSARHWLYQGQDYVLLVNSSEEAVEFVINDIPAVEYNDIFNSVLYSSQDEGLTMQLPSLGVALLVSEEPLPGFLTDM